MWVNTPNLSLCPPMTAQPEGHHQRLTPQPWLSICRSMSKQISVHYKLPSLQYFVIRAQNGQMPFKTRGKDRNECKCNKIDLFGG